MEPLILFALIAAAALYIASTRAARGRHDDPLPVRLHRRWSQRRRGRNP